MVVVTSVSIAVSSAVGASVGGAVAGAATASVATATTAGHDDTSICLVLPMVMDGGNER